MKKNTHHEVIIQAEYQAVYHFVLSFTKSTEIAQDITQETFFKAIKSYSTFRGDSSLYTWLCSIAKNLWINQCKKEQRECILFDDVATSSDLEEKIVDRDSAFAIHQILHTMKEPYKEVFTLRTFGELSFAEISRLFGKTESWARVTYYRSRKMITSQLERNGEDYENSF